MPRGLRTLVLTTLPALSGAPSSAGTSALDAAWVKAFASKDLDGLMALYARGADTASTTADGRILRGWEAIRADFATTFQAMKSIEVLSLEEVHHRQVKGGVFGWGVAVMRFTPAQGEASVVRMQFADFRRPEPGGWTFVYDSVRPLPAK
jgi:ketosteroid isomerase-like protein